MAAHCPGLVETLRLVLSDQTFPLIIGVFDNNYATTDNQHRRSEPSYFRVSTELHFAIMFHFCCFDFFVRFF
jgi:hypothetical protein